MKSIIIDTNELDINEKACEDLNEFINDYINNK